MKEIVKFLSENFDRGCLATVEDGKPRARPFGFMYEEDCKFYFCTSNTKDVYKQLKACPFVEFSVTSSDMVTVRLQGEVKFTDDLGVKEKIFEVCPMVKDLYKTADNPVFEAFYIEHGTAVMFDFSGQPPKKFEF